MTASLAATNRHQLSMLPLFSTTLSTTSPPQRNRPHNDIWNSRRAEGTLLFYGSFTLRHPASKVVRNPIRWRRILPKRPSSYQSNPGQLCCDSIYRDTADEFPLPSSAPPLMWGSLQSPVAISAHHAPCPLCCRCDGKRERVSREGWWREQHLTRTIFPLAHCCARKWEEREADVRGVFSSYWMFLRTAWLSAAARVIFWSKPAAVERERLGEAR